MADFLREFWAETRFGWMQLAFFIAVVTAMGLHHSWKMRRQAELNRQLNEQRDVYESEIRRLRRDLERAHGISRSDSERDA